MDFLKSVLVMFFGQSWVTTLIGYVAALAVASVAYFSASTEPGWYAVAAGFAALGRWAAAEKAKREAPPVVPVPPPPEQVP